MQSREPSDELRANVHADETIEWVVRPHRGVRFLANAGRGAIGALVGAAVVAALVAGLLLFVVETPQQTAIAAGVGAFLLLGLLSLRGALTVLLFGSTEYAATDGRLLRYGGVFGRRLDGVPFEGIQDAEYSVSTVENLFDVGTVTLDTRQGYERLRFEHVPDPAVFAREVSDLASEVHEAAEPGTPGTYGPSDALATAEPGAGLTDNCYGHEELQWVVRPRRSAQLLRRLPGSLLRTALLGLFLGFIAAAAALFATGQVETALLAVAGVAAVVLLLFLAVAVATYLLDETQYAATDRRLIYYDATIGRRLDSVPLRGVQDAEYRVSPLGNLFDVGTVTVDTDRGYETLAFESVPDPATFAREVSRLAASDLGQGAVVDAAAAKTDDLVTREPGNGLRESVSADEAIEWVVRPHGGARFLGTVGSSIVGAGFAGLILGAIAGVVVTATVDTSTGGLAAVAVFLAVLVLLLVKPALQFLFGGSEYALTDDRLVDYSGLFSRELRSVPLAGIQDAEYRVSSTENLFGVGTVTVDTHPGYETMTLDTVSNPAAVAREISRAASTATTGEGAPEPPGESRPGVKAGSPDDDLN